MPGILPASASEGRTTNRAILADEKMLELSPHGSREFPFILQRIVLSGLSRRNLAVPPASGD